MKIDKRFPLQILTTLVVVGVFSAYPLVRFGTGEIALAVVYGALLSTLNVLIGFLAIEYSFEKSYTTFLTAVLGGMGVRMVVVMGILVALILVAHVHATALTVSLLVFYLIHLVLEILFIQRKTAAKNKV